MLRSIHIVCLYNVIVHTIIFSTLNIVEKCLHKILKLSIKSLVEYKMLKSEESMHLKIAHSIQCITHYHGCVISGMAITIYLFLISLPLTLDVNFRIYILPTRTRKIISFNVYIMHDFFQIFSHNQPFPSA